MLGARILEILELSLGGPSDDRPCTTTQLRGHGLSTGGATIYIYICLNRDIYI